MAVKVLCDSVNPVENRASFERAIADAIGDRAGRWNVWLSQLNTGFPLTVMITGPDGLRVSYIFKDPEQQTAVGIRSRIAALLAIRCEDATL